MAMHVAQMTVVVVVLFACVTPAGATEQHKACPPDVLLDWNEKVVAIGAAEDSLLTLKTVRTAAMVHIAIHDAINAIHRHYASYAFDDAGGKAEPIAAAAQAAYEVAASQYPDREGELRQLLDATLDGFANREVVSRSIRLGKHAAAAILRKREGDGWNAEIEYRWLPPGPGVYAPFPEHSQTPPGFVFGTGWARAKPFVLRAPDQFRVAPPPAINSSAYAAAFNEVKSVGSVDSAVRTNDQTHLAYWWKDFAESSHNRLARQLVAAHQTDLWSAARLFALLNTALFDGYVASFDSKFAYNHWRPYTAIRAAGRDGNPRTEPDVQWTNTHRHTYPFPSYPSAHGTVCAAAMTVLADTFGDALRFTMETKEVSASGPLSPKIEMQPPTRSFDSFSAAATECASSRVYLGIHFRYDATAGTELGRNVGRFAVSRYFVPWRTGETAHR